MGRVGAVRSLEALLYFPTCKGTCDLGLILVSYSSKPSTSMADGGGVLQEKLAFFLMELSPSPAQELEEQRGISGNWHS